MPQYNFICKQCRKNFFIICGINDDEKRNSAACSECGSHNVRRVFDALVLKSRKGEPEKEEPEKEKIHHEHSHDECSPEADYL